MDTPKILSLLWQKWVSPHKPDPPHAREGAAMLVEHPGPTSSVDVGQPYPYRRRELVEPDWTRFPGWADVTTEQWESAQWQRSHCVKNLKQLRTLLGDLVDETF